MLERGLKEEIVLKIEDKVQTIPPLGPTQQSPDFVKTLTNSSPHYDKLKIKRYVLSTTVPLKSETLLSSKAFQTFLIALSLSSMNFLFLNETYFMHTQCTSLHLE